MMNRRGVWLRVWLVFAGAFLASTLAVMAAAWPKHDSAIIGDLRSPECQVWLEKAAGTFPGGRVDPQQPCASIRSFLDRKRVTIRSEEDYDRYLTGTGIRSALTVLASWAGFVGAVYLIGWAGLRLARVFPARDEQKDV